MASNGAFLAMDTSNYTTSCALYEPENRRMQQQKQLLPVAQGQRGLRQSDAVFHHTVQLPALMQQLLAQGHAPLRAIGVSARPRDVQGSYMPCFLVGCNVAQCMAAVQDIPLYSFSHQAGHVAAALYSAERVALFAQMFLAFHVSGGTTELLLVRPDDKTIFTISRIGGTSDLNAGQAIDRIGVALGCAFPAGPQLDVLAQQSTQNYRSKPRFPGLECSFSGLENQCRQRMEQGDSKADISRYCLAYILEVLSLLLERAKAQYGALPVVCSGGVMANTLLRAGLQRRHGAVFAKPEYSVDNAAGIAVLAARQWERDQSCSKLWSASAN